MCHSANLFNTLGQADGLLLTVISSAEDAHLLRDMRTKNTFISFYSKLKCSGFIRGVKASIEA